MKLIYKIITMLFCSGFLLTGCNYLDVEPEKKGSLEEAFSTVTNARNFLYACYSYMPHYSYLNDAPELIGASDELCLTSQWATTWHFGKVPNIGGQTAADPLFNYWSHFKSETQPDRCIAYNLYGAIRQCYTFLNRIKSVPQISDDNVNMWSAEAKFLIAYYHYCLLRLYGPIVIIEEETPFEGPEEVMYPKRQPYDKCVEWIANLLDEVAFILPPRQASSEFGKPTSVAAKGIKARMLLYAASPLFNGNAEYYSNFTNKDGESLMDLEYKKSKWLAALTATEEAINLAHDNGYSLFECPKIPQGATDKEKAYLTARYMIVMQPSEGNTDVIWTYTGSATSLQQFNTAKGISTGSTTVPYGGISPSFQMVETYYTKNGLPLDKDPEYNYPRRYGSAVDPETGETTARLNLDREPRFYGQIAYDRSKFESDGIDGTSSAKPLRLYMRMGEVNPVTGLSNGNDPLKDNIAPNGYILKKLYHPSTSFKDNKVAQKNYGMPLLRLTELYLNYAEAYYEYYEKLDGIALFYFNEIRRRANIPDVDDAWQGIEGKDYREIIRQERTIELIGEGHRFFDARRWKTAHLTFSKVQKRWNCFASGFSSSNVQPAADYLTVRNSNEPPKAFEVPKHYLYPIDSRDVDTNPNMVQNPGW